MGWGFVRRGDCNSCDSILLIILTIEGLEEKYVQYYKVLSIPPLKCRMQQRTIVK